MSDCEQIAPVAHIKRATMSDSLRSLMINEQMSDSLNFFGLKSFFKVGFIYVFLFKKMSASLIPSFLVSDVSESLRSLTKNEQCERIAQVAHQKWVTMSDLLRLLTKNKRTWATGSGRSPKKS